VQRHPGYLIPVYSFITVFGVLGVRLLLFTWRSTSLARSRSLLDTARLPIRATKKYEIIRIYIVNMEELIIHRTIEKRSSRKLRGLGGKETGTNIGDVALARLTHRVIEHLLLEVQDVEHAVRRVWFCDVEGVVACASRFDLVDSLGGCI
jgi:hypothetical protein